MSDFAKSPDSREIKIQRLNGWLRFSLWVILFFVAVGTLAGFFYWQRTKRMETAQKEARGTALDLIVKAIKISDSLDAERHKEVMGELRRLHPVRNQTEKTPQSLDTEKLYEQLQPREKK